MEHIGAFQSYHRALNLQVCLLADEEYFYRDAD